MTKFRRVSSLILIFYLVTLLLGGQSYWYAMYENQIEENKIQLNRFTGQLTNQLEKYSYIPQLLSKDSELIDALKNPLNSAQIDVTNRYLHNVNSIIGASDTYLLNKIGTTIAASNWNSDTSFVDRNFAFRPYFQQAMEGRRGQYFALGFTSGKRGFYYTYPIIYAADIIGVIVVKTDLHDVEQYWSSDNSYYIATDFDGVIFMSSKRDWLYRTLFPVTEAKKKQIIQERRYIDQTIDDLGFIHDHSGTSGQIQSPASIPFYNRFLSTKQRLDDLNLDIRILTPVAVIFWLLFEFIIIATLVYALIFVSWLLIYHRQNRQRQIAQIEMETKQKLEFQVMERTAKLQMEINEREKTELMLRQTQEELIQAAKLAVLGQMSASISHELNNPLAAIRSFAENGKRFLDKGQPERTQDNLTRISALTDRMAVISQQLKSFARKSSIDERVVAQIRPIIISSLELMKPQIKANQIELSTNIENGDLTAQVNLVQLEQVLINLLANAIDELKEADRRHLRVTLCDSVDLVTIHIDDSGKGLAPEVALQLFEPFYTTKKNGLGLGLSISLQIMQTMGGNLSCQPSDLGGARFTVSLAKAPYPLKEN